MRSPFKSSSILDSTATKHENQKKRSEVPAIVVVVDKEEQKMKKKNKNNSQCVQWSDREVDWYYSESRFIFTAENAIDLQKWIVVLQWLTSSSS